MKKATSKKLTPRTIRGIAVAGVGGPCTYTDTRRPCYVCGVPVEPEYVRIFDGALAEATYGDCSNGHDVIEQLTALMDLPKEEQLASVA